MIRVKRRQYPRKTVQERRIRGRVDQALLVDALQHRLRAVADHVPEGGVELGEEGPRGPVPAVPEVLRELFEPCEALGNARIDFEEVAGTWRHEICRAAAFRLQFIPGAEGRILPKVYFVGTL